MSVRSAASAVAIFLASSCALQPGRSDDSGDLKEQLIALEKQSWIAWQDRDGGFFEKFLAADHVEVGSSGPAGKASIVAFVGSPACVVESYSVDDFRMSRPTGDTALLLYRVQQKTTCGGVAVPSPAWASSWYVFRDGRWQNVAYQQSPAV